MDEFILEQPEFLIEDVVSFSNGAFELIPEKFYGKDFALTRIPDGPSYYSGVLQAMGHFLVNQSDDKRKTIFIFVQNMEPDKILLLDYKSIILGEKYTLGQLPQKSLDAISGLKMGQNVEFESRLEMQLSFLRFFNRSGEILPFFVGEKVAIHDLESLIKSIVGQNGKKPRSSNKSAYNIFLVDNIAPCISYDETIKKHEGYINAILGSKSARSLPFNAKVFKSLLGVVKKEAHIVNYFNANSFSGNKVGGDGYICLVS